MNPDWWMVILTALSTAFVAVGMGGGLMKYLLDRHLTELDARIGTVSGQSKDSCEQIQRLQREVLELKATFPIEYVRRDDFIRAWSTVDGKLELIFALVRKVELVVEGIKERRHE